jgi:TatD DNase family protein
MIDSHTHLDSCAPDDALLVERARAAGVGRMLTVGMDEGSNRRALAAAERFGAVRAAVGRHPNAAAGFDDAAAEDLRALAAHPRCAAIGETGLDFFRDRASRADQMRAFHAQIDLAHETGLPLVIHTRAAEEDTLAVLTARAAGLRVILHCFSMPDHLDACLEQPDWWLSFAGNVTYPSAGDLAAAAERVPDDRLLVETDAPYLSPQPVRGERNEPAFVVHTARFIADRRGVALEELERTVERNAAGLFGW